jgi:hypothetical protein
VEPRERWQALQAKLTAARGLAEQGDSERALAEIESALAIDPDFLAAHTLRERILNAPAASPSSPDVVVSQPAGGALIDVAPRPLVSSEGYARFEERARRRRVDRRVEAARAAIADNRLKDAAAALDEVRELDPNLPELPGLASALEQARRKRGRSHRGASLAAAAVFAAMVFAGTWLKEPQPLPSRPVAVHAVVASGYEPSPVTSTAGADTAEGISTAGVSTGSKIDLPERRSAPPRAASIERPRVEAPRTAFAPAPLPIVPLNRTITPSAAAPPPPPAVVELTPSAVAPPSSGSTIPVRANEEGLVHQVLQRYRYAYDDLDARSARAVWPAVNEAALTRAFQSLQSQQLTFDACDVQLRGGLATATCRGTARYVTKVGSRDPHIEPRVWNFTLKKLGDDWKIETARAER